MSNLVKRVLSALILGPLVIYIAYAGGYIFMALVFAIFALMLYEWVNITKRLKQKLLWFIFGFFYLGIACTSLFALGLGPYRASFMGFEQMPVLLFFILLVVWINDISSYFIGKLVGGPKLAPKISPNKTWAGAIGGIIGCLLFFFIVNYERAFGADVIGDDMFIIALGLHILVPVIAQIGDLFESYIKRLAGVKDSGNIIPGHGGVLDRLDGLLLVLNAFALYSYIVFSISASKVAAQGAAL